MVCSPSIYEECWYLIDWWIATKYINNVVQDALNQMKTMQCPHCGGLAIIEVREDKKYWITCSECKYSNRLMWFLNQQRALKLHRDTMVKALDTSFVQL